jgi:HSP20 family molecular chaperone IbpA
MFFTPLAPISALTRRAAYDPGLRSLDRSLERFLHDAALTPTPQVGTKGYAVDHTDTAYTLSIDVPGLGKEHLNIGIEGAVVRIESLVDAPRKVKAAYEFPQDIDASASTAKMEHGVLSLTLVKKVPVSNVASLSIQ